MRLSVSRSRGRRGVTLPLVCVMLTALLGGAALAVDIGRMYLTGGEAQAAADASALAGARFLQQYAYNNVGFINTSYGIAPIAAASRVAGAAAQVQNVDVVPVAYNPSTNTTSPSSWNYTTSAVQVTVRATPRYVFAGALGLTPPSVQRTATAWIANVNGATCVRPLALPYTRFYEGGMHNYNQDSVWTLGGGAPDYTYKSVSSLQPIYPYNNPPVGRTYTAIPQWEPEAKWDSTRFTIYTHFINGRWFPTDFAGGGVSAYQTYLGAAPKSSSCQPASAQVGVNTIPLPGYDNPSATDKQNLLNATAVGMNQLCHRLGNNTDAHCYDSTGAVGVRVRVFLADSVSGASPYALHTREVTMVRIMCYFESLDDVCAPAYIRDENSTTSATTLWQLYGSAPGVYSKYPPGTISVLLDGPTNMDLTADVILGNKPGITQRIMLVK